MSKTRGKKFKNNEPGGSRLKIAEGYIRRELLRIAASIAYDPNDAVRSSRTVKCLLTITNTTFPRWKDLTDTEKLVFYQCEGFHTGINTAVTFNISDEQRVQWVSKYGDITKGFKKEIIHNVRHYFPDGLDYWLIIEPKVSRGEEALNYRDEKGAPRRFDCHFAVRLDGYEQTIRFQKAIWKRAYKLNLDVNPEDAFPLYKLGRSAYQRKIYDFSGSVHWNQYSRKFVDNTKSLHADVTGDLVYGVSSNIKGRAAEKYEAFRKSMSELPPISEKILLDVHKSLVSEGVNLNKIELAGQIKEAHKVINLVYANHFPAPSPTVTETTKFAEPASLRGVHKPLRSPEMRISESDDST